MWNRITEAWCRATHEKVMWPIHGVYRCGQCMREYRVEWSPEEHDASGVIAQASVSIDVCA